MIELIFGLVGGLVIGWTARWAYHSCYNEWKDGYEHAKYFFKPKCKECGS